MGCFCYAKMERMGSLNFKKKMILALAVLVVAVAGVFLWRDQGRKNELAVGQAATRAAAKRPAAKNDSQNNSAANLPAAPAPAKAEKTAPATPATEAESAPANSQPAAPKIVNRLVSWGFTKTDGREIDTIIIHSSYNATGGDPHDVNAIIDKEYKPNDVSPHYIIGRGGTIYRLVPDEDIAYHAGVSRMPDGRTNVNNFSIGIEVVETMSESPSAAQYASLNSLIDYLAAKYPIKHILGHSDIAPGRKTDPWNFDWKKITLGKEE